MIPLEADKYYHIYNHANGHEQLFLKEENYNFFLTKFKEKVMPAVKVLAYCLMPNHFHLLVQVKEESAIDNFFQSTRSLPEFGSFPKFQTLEKLTENKRQLFVSKCFGNLFSSYTQSFNRIYHRQGSLFNKNFKRKEVDTEDYFRKLVNYIHFNPVIHGIVDSPDQWKYSSYNAIMNQKTTLVCRNETLSWFDGIENFIYNHRYPLDI